MNVLLLGAAGSAGINFARAIQPRHTVVGVDTNPVMAPLAACPIQPLYPGRDKLGRINQLINDWDIDFVHAQPDPEVQWLAEHQHLVAARTMVPHPSVVKICQDKLALAQTLGRDLCPRSYHVSVGAFRDALHDKAWMRLRRGAGSMGALPVRSWEMVELWLDHWHRERDLLADEWMLADILPGKDLSWTGVYKDGELVASACKERTSPMGASRHPANVSSTAAVQTIVSRPDVNGRCEEAVKRLDEDADGVWMFDLRETEDGVPLITECNVGRFGTTSLFWKAAGGNLPLMYVNGADHWPTARAVPDRDCCRVGATWLRTPDATPVLAGGLPAHLQAAA